MKLVDGADEQRILEEMLDASKPPVPAACQHLHYLQFTPFRYAARYATRFRPVGERRGVYYAAEAVKTAATEVAFYRALFYFESPATTPPVTPFEMTAFCTTIGTEHAIDVSTMVDAQRYAHPTDYGQCHKLAGAGRDVGAEIIRFPSARHDGGMNVGVLACAAFKDTQPRDLQGWWFRFSATGLFATQRFGAGRLDFPYTMFADDPRVRSAL